jgi:hypothetical protein
MDLIGCSCSFPRYVGATVCFFAAHTTLICVECSRLPQILRVYSLWTLLGRTYVKDRTGMHVCACMHGPCVCAGGTRAMLAE